MNARFHKLLLLICFSLAFSVAFSASKVQKGFEALRVYDYFLAKKIFYQVNAKKNDAQACYGLALIFSRNDNPFSNADSALKYVYLSYNSFLKTPSPVKFSGFTIDGPSILSLADSVSYRRLRQIKKENTIEGFNRFLTKHYLAKKKWLDEAANLRDELEFDRVLAVNKSDSTAFFIETHPGSPFLLEAEQLKDQQLFEEYTRKQTAEEYIRFLKKFPRNAMVNTASEKLFAIYSRNKDVKGLGSFVKDFPDSPQNIEAWKLLFSLSVKEYSYSELKKFLETYPGFPLKNTILKELELNKLVLYPYKGEEFTGFIDENGKQVIAPQYDEAGDFYEGLSVVSRNDSVFFINKENVNAFGEVYKEASHFKNGIAPVKKDGKWHFINRQGQMVSPPFDEINELSNQVYVVKLNGKYGALNHFGQQIIEPRFEKLGDFKNGFAYFNENGKYGFVSKQGQVNKARFDWISDFDDNLVAVFKLNEKYGLINAAGTEIHPPEFDQIVKTGSDIHLVIIGNNYGFFSSEEGCYLSAVAYDYLKEKPASFYTDGTILKFIKDEKQALADRNGRVHINYGAYQEVNFLSNGLMRVKQKNKYGYIDKKLNVVIPYKYQQAGDFEDGIAIVKLKESTILINTSGTEVYSSVYSVEKISVHFYLVNDNARTIINNAGEAVFTGVSDIQNVNKHLLIITLNTGEIKLLYD